MLTCQHSAAVFMSLSAALRMWDTVPSSKGFCSSAAITFHQKANTPFKTPVNHPHLPSHGCVSERSWLQKSAQLTQLAFITFYRLVRLPLVWMHLWFLWRTWQVFLVRERESVRTCPLLKRKTTADSLTVSFSLPPPPSETSSKNFWSLTEPGA